MKQFICKYAGDMEDEYCGVCDGIMAAMADGETLPANQCPGFEPGDTEVPTDNAEDVAEAETIEEVTCKPAPAEPEKEVEEAPFEPDENVEEKPVVEEKPKKTTTKKETKTETAKPKKEPVRTVEQSCTALGEIVEIRIDSGVSFEANAGNWYKLNYGETRRVSNDIDINAVRKDMWDKANEEVDNQMADIINSLKTTK